MLLLTMNEWFGPGRKMDREQSGELDVTEEKTAFATRLNLADALERIHQYELAHNERYKSAVNYKLLTVATIDELSDELLENVGVIIAEKLKQKPEDFDA